jgi:hypothetical protein
VVGVLETGNEIIDFFAHGGWEWHDTLADAAATWFWPVVLWSAVKLCPWLTNTRTRDVIRDKEGDPVEQMRPQPLDG